MKSYDPTLDIRPEEWLAVDESERILLVERYHRKSKDLAESPRLHAIVHVVVENQLAMPDGEAARKALKRLMSERVSRHSAIHAIGSVVATQVFAIVKDTEEKKVFDSAAYEISLENLKASQWRAES
jgi:hypothetical protein